MSRPAPRAALPPKPEHQIECNHQTIPQPWPAQRHLSPAFPICHGVQFGVSGPGRETFSIRRCPTKQSTVAFMNVARQFGFSFLLLAPLLTYAQHPPASTSPSDSQPLEIRLAKPPSWQGNCLQLTIRLANRSKSPIFLPDRPFEGIEVYSSVTD